MKLLQLADILKFLDKNSGILLSHFSPVLWFMWGPGWAGRLVCVAGRGAGLGWVGGGGSSEIGLWKGRLISTFACSLAGIAGVWFLGSGRWAMSPPKFKIFPIFLISYGRSATRETTRISSLLYYISYVSFYLWRLGPVLKHLKSQTIMTRIVGIGFIQHAQNFPKNISYPLIRRRTCAY